MKHCWVIKLAKILLAIWGIFLHENNCNYNSCRFNYKFAFIFFLYFLTNQKQKSGFQQVSGLVTINISVFLFIVSRNPGDEVEWVSLYFKTMSNSINFYKGTFLHVIPVRVIVPCINWFIHQFLNCFHSGISIKWTPLVQKMWSLYRDVCFIEIFHKIVLPQSKAVRSSSYCPSYRGVRFIVCPLYRDSTALSF